MICCLIQVFGLVQEVFFRYSAKTEAKKLSLVGYIKNLDDGSVEIIICGNKEKINEFMEWCRNGSAMAKVERVEANEVEFKEFTKFDIL